MTKECLSRYIALREALKTAKAAKSSVEARPDEMHADNDVKKGDRKVDKPIELDTRTETSKSHEIVEENSHCDQKVIQPALLLSHMTDSANCSASTSATTKISSKNPEKGSQRRISQSGMNSTAAPFQPSPIMVEESVLLRLLGFFVTT